MEQENKTFALYKVSYKNKNDYLNIDLILTKGRKDIPLIKKIITALTGRRGITKIKLKYRKVIVGQIGGVDGNINYQQLNAGKVERKRVGGLRKKYAWYVKKNPIQHLANNIHYSRHLFLNIQDLHNNIKRNHHQQHLMYRFNIQFGLTLRNNQTGEVRNFYPSNNTSFYDEQPIINNSIESVLLELELDSIIDRIKRPNSQWVVDNIYEYLIMTTPLPDKLPGSI